MIANLRIIVNCIVEITRYDAATHCSALQHAATHCNTLQHTATHCNALQHRVFGNDDRDGFVEITRYDAASQCSALQHASTCCNTGYLATTIAIALSKPQDHTPQHTATHRNALQHAATQGLWRRRRDIFVETTRSNTATHCNTLQHTAMHCNTLQHGVFGNDDRDGFVEIT